jgi:hypothetical protein
MLWYAYSNSSINHSYMLSLPRLSLDMAVLDSARLLVLSFKLLCVELYYFSIIFLYSQTPWNRVCKDVDPSPVPLLLRPFLNVTIFAYLLQTVYHDLSCTWSLAYMLLSLPQDIAACLCLCLSYLSLAACLPYKNFKYTWVYSNMSNI